ncbi:MAG: hypothetical protein ABUT39_13515 [Acidobacteriota bacterium]
MEDHPEAEQIMKFLEGRSEGTQARILIAHLLRGCPVCSAIAEPFLRPKRRKLPPDAYDVAFERVLARIQPYRAPARPLPNPAMRRAVCPRPGLSL